VNEFLSNAGLDIDECKPNAAASDKEHCLDEFNPESEDYPTDEKSAFLGSMELLQKHCTEVAMKSFALVKEQDPNVDLTPLCDFSGYDPTGSVLEVVDAHRKEVDGLVRSAILKWREFEVEEDDEPNVNLKGPGLLAPVIKEYKETSSLSSTYMPQWSTRGRFLTAMAKLKQLEAEMSEYFDKLEKLIAELNDQLADNKKKLALAKAAVEDAIKANEVAQNDVNDVLALIEQLEQKETDLDTNLKELLRLRKEAKKKYDGAIKEFDTFFKAGVPQKFSFIQREKFPSLSSLKPIKRVS